MDTGTDAVLGEWADWLETHTGDRILLEGHTDHIGTREDNLVLGERMAEAVKDRLVEMGVAPGRMDIVTYGEHLPTVPIDHPNAADLNRRAVISIIGAEPLLPVR